jgi:hypothetical protein
VRQRTDGLAATAQAAFMRTAFLIVQDRTPSQTATNHGSTANQFRDTNQNQREKEMKMNRFDSYSKRLMWLIPCLLAAFSAGCGGGSEGRSPILGAGASVISAPAGPGPVNLGLAAPFAIAATAGVTNTATAPITHINGDVVLNPNDTCNGVAVGNAGNFGLCGGSPPTISGTVITPTFPDTTTANAVKADLQAAFLSITPPAGPPAAGSLGGATNIPAGTTLGAPAGSPLVQGDNLFVAGVYQSTTSILITGDLTLDAQGDPNAVFIFQSSSTVGSAAGAASPGAHTRILLINGAKASNVWWQVGTSATLGTNSEWQGNILASADVTMTTGATSCGRLFAGAFTAGAFVFDSNVVSVPGNVNAPAGCQ